MADPQGNDEPEVYIGYMAQQEDQYPEFLLFNNATNTITFRPDRPIYAGQTYYFTIVVKETNSDSVAYSYYCTVRIDGGFDESVEFVGVDYTISLDEDNLGNG